MAEEETRKEQRPGPQSGKATEELRGRDEAERKEKERLQKRQKEVGIDEERRTGDPHKQG